MRDQRPTTEADARGQSVPRLSRKRSGLAGGIPTRYQLDWRLPLESGFVVYEHLPLGEVLRLGQALPIPAHGSTGGQGFLKKGATGHPLESATTQEENRYPQNPAWTFGTAFASCSRLPIPTWSAPC
jgi:hypothetical protein